MSSLACLGVNQTDTWVVQPRMLLICLEASLLQARCLELQHAFDVLSYVMA